MTSLISRRKLAVTLSTLLAWSSLTLLGGCPGGEKTKSNSPTELSMDSNRAAAAATAHSPTDQSPSDEPRKKKGAKKKSGPGERNVDVAVMEWHSQDIGEGNRKTDVFKKAPFRINVFQDEGYQSVNRVKVDLDRDGAWDEVWSFRDSHGKIFLKTGPKPDGGFAKTFKWENGTWKRVKRK